MAAFLFGRHSMNHILDHIGRFLKSGALRFDGDVWRTVGVESGAHFVEHLFHFFLFRISLPPANVIEKNALAQTAIAKASFAAPL